MEISFEFPVESKPSFLQRILGVTEFILEPDHIILKDEKIYYENVISHSLTGSEIKLEDNNENSYLLQAGFKSSKYFEIIEVSIEELEVYLKAYDFDVKENIDHSFSKVMDLLKLKTLPYVRAVNLVLKAAMVHKLTDLHFEPSSNKTVVVTGRKGDEILKLLTLPIFEYERMMARLKYLAGCLSHISDKAQEGAFEFEGVNIRLSSFPTDHGERLSMRFIGNFEYLTLESLGWAQNWIDSWLNLIDSQSGLYIIAGSVGSGKTTAMYATLAEIVSKTSQLRVVTIEDPVEAFITGICQSSLHSMEEKNLAKAFKYLLRQDPNIIALGEIRDKECIQESMQAALSGHRVFATFHAGSAQETLDRIKQMAAGNSLILSGLKGILYLELKRKNNAFVPKVLLSKFDSNSLEEIV